MAFLSLRFTISALSALSVLLVASVTLTITLTSSFNALQTVGLKHTTALLRQADADSEALFRRGTDFMSELVNASTYRQWPWPSEDNTTFIAFDTLMHTQILVLRDISNAIVFFADNTRVAYADDLVQPIYMSRQLLASNYTRDFPNQTITTDLRWYTDDGARIAANETILPQRIRDTPQWALFDIMTNGSTTPTIAGFQITPTVDDYILAIDMVAPLYVSGKQNTGQANVLGYTSVSISLDRFSGFLRDVKSTARSAAFIYDGGFGFLLGSSEAAPFTVRRPLSTPVPIGCLLSNETTSVVEQKKEPFLFCGTTITNYPHEALNDLAQDPNAMRPVIESVSRRTIGGEMYYVAVSKITIKIGGIEPYLLILIPESDIIGDVVRSRNVALAITLGMVVAVAILGGLGVWRLLAPLSLIASRMVKAANLEDDGTEEEVSYMAEVAQLQLAYYEMNSELKRIRSYVPQSVLVARRAERQGETSESELEEISNEHSFTSSQQASDYAVESAGSTPKSAARISARGFGPRRQNSAPRMKALRRSTDISGSNSSGGAAMPTRTISVLAANLRGLHAAAAKATSDALVAEISDAVTAIEAAVTERQGVLTFHGDRFLATFNTARPCASHATRAATAAVALTEHAHAGPLRLKLTCGVATGPCVVGSMGSATMKTFCTVGAAVTDAATLERLTVLYGVQALATHRTCVDASSSCGVRYVDLVALTSKDSVRAVAIAALQPQSKARRMSDSDGNRAAGEWMYVLNNNDAFGDALSPFNRCFELLQRNDCEGALAAYRRVSVECDRIREGIADSAAAAALLPPPRLAAMVEILAAGSVVDTVTLCRDLGLLHYKK
jgi:class 3 adenylate cyclase